MKRATLDFESHPIESRPRHPPVPVGLAFHLPRGAYTYAAWGHESGNGLYVRKGQKLVKVRDADPERAAHNALREARDCDSILGHNIAKFDTDVSETHMGVKLPSHKIDDTLWSGFLTRPHSRSLRLKDSAEEVLGIPPSERDAVFDWLFEHGHTSRRMEKGVYKYGSKENPAAKWVWKAPGDLVAEYAIGDLTRPEGLMDHDMPLIKKLGMLKAYELERAVAPILLRNERQGMRVDVELLASDQKLYKVALAKVETWLRKKLGASPGINWDADAEVAACLKKSGQVKIFPKTDGGKDSVSKNRLTAEFYRDADVYCALIYRNTVSYVLNGNIDPWLETALESGGFIYTEWNQVPNGERGARSGRITCSKLANIIKDPTGGKAVDYLVADDARVRKLIGLPPLPLARKYCLADDGDSFGHVDWNQQEIRLTAHFEEAELAAAYRSDSKVDIHKFATDLINRASGQGYIRAVIKHVNLRQFYGGGQEGLVTHPMLRLDKKMKCRLDCHHRETRCEAYKAAGAIVRDWRKGLPGVVQLTDRLKKMYERGEPIRTIGGRLYNCKPPAIAKKGARKGQMVSFEYTGLNYLIQPSGADCLKAALVAHEEHPKRRARLLGTVYDEINISAPKKIAAQQVKILQEVMEATTKLDVPWRTDGEVRERWGDK